ncbi:SH3 domain-containing protein [Cytobacillus sp. FJAT-54145]|uniref:SH3 domain-containing protein n=1 Tax=Cytobacillus spartinae TaxID=3299023 RepID=A0ABW6KBR5_9BACI
MNRSKKIIAAGALTIGIGAGAYLFTPQGMSASSNVVLASVDWVTSQLNPVKTKVSDLESKVATQQQEINNLKAQLAKLGSPTTPPTTPPTDGQLPSTVYVNKSSVTIHSGATTKYKIVATKTMGSALKVVGSHNSATGLWYNVELSSTLKGWVQSSDISITAPSNTTPTQVVAFGDVHLRKGATTGYTILTTIPKGTTLKYISTFVNTSGETWYNVETSSGLKGWVYGGLTEVR